MRRQGVPGRGLTRPQVRTAPNDLAAAWAASATLSAGPVCSISAPSSTQTPAIYSAYHPATFVEDEMNTLNYIAKYVEYNLKVARYFLINDTRFHTQRLRTLLNREANLIHPVTLNEKMCYRLIYDRNPL